ncbi:MAG: phage virion morphogenesis protein [Panacagrimonas sp.]
MAGTFIRIEIEDAAARATLKRLVERGQDLRPALGEVGEYLGREMWPKRFRDKRGPDGLPWAPVSELYAKRKRAGTAAQARGDARSASAADLLELTGELMDFPRYQFAGLNALDFGVNTKWAATHQFGDPARNIPARPFLWLDADDEDEIRQVFVSWLDTGQT